VDQQFKELMRDVQSRPGVVDVCATDGRAVELSTMSKELEKCNKALTEYLDLKKNIFPRFYFVSNVALLDILSNGNNPPKIMPHLSSVFDGIGSLTLVEPEQPPPKEGEEDAPKSALVPNTASAMNATDGESVTFPGLFEIKGQVESWLNDLTQLAVLLGEGQMKILGESERIYRSGDLTAC